MSTVEVALNELANVDRIWHLRRARLLEGLSEDDLVAVSSVCRDQIYYKGDAIFLQGEPAHSVFILNRGCIRLSVVNGEDQERILSFHTAGDIFGENMLTPEEYFQSEATAHEDSWVSIIPRQHFLALIRQRVSVAFNYMRVLGERLSDAQEEIEAQSFLDTRQRLGKVLLKLAEKHGKPVLGQKDMVKLKICITHDELARLIAANRPHVSTIISGFKKEGWIDYQARKILINVDAFKILLNGAALPATVGSN